ncbi:MAG: PhnD/SsuA/transferrin family substrate-binding protein [Caldimicrobium sp.]
MSCEALTNYLNLKSKNFIYECQYQSFQEILQKKPSNFTLAILNPVLFIELKHIYSKNINEGFYPLFNIYSLELSKNGLQGAVIFTKNSETINSLKDIKGKKVALLSECNSSSILTLYELKKAGFDLDRDIKFLYKENWEKVIESVLKGEAQVGAVRTGVIEYLKKHSNIKLSTLKFLNLKKYPDFPFLVSTELIPEWFFIYTRKASPELIANIYNILTPFVRKGPIPMTNLEVNIPYDPVKVLQMQKELMVGPYAYLKEELKKAHRKALILYAFLSLISASVTGIILYLYYKQSRYRREIEKSAKFLEDTLQIKSKTLSEVTQKLSEEMKKLEKIVGTLDIGIALINKEGIILRANQAFEKIFNYKKSLKYSNFRKISQNIQPLPEEKTEFNLDAESFNFRAKHKTNGAEKYLFINKVPIEETPYYLITVRDITLEKKWEEEITQYTQLETLRVIASGLAHDLNNLLGAIVSNIELLYHHYKKDIPQEVKEGLEKIKNNSLRAKALTQQLLIYGKSLILSSGSYSPYSWLKELCDLVFAGTSIEVQYRIDPEVKKISGDKNLLGFALHNILINARKSIKYKLFIKIS